MRKRSPSLLQVMAEYFGTYLTSIKGVSQNTITSYQYTFRLLFEFMQEKLGIEPEKVTFESLANGNVIQYLNWLEKDRGCSVQTRNQRRAAIASFAKYTAKKALTQSLDFVSDVADIPMKKTPKTQNIRYFTKDEITILLKLPDTTLECGRRDAVLMSVLYCSGARAQEICDLTVNDISFGSTTTIRLVGKGRKARVIVIPEKCAHLLDGYLKSKNLGTNVAESRFKHVFSSQTHEKMTISCVEAIVKKYVRQAKEYHPLLFKRSRYSPHSFRHSIAVHMLECGESLAVIRAFLGHSSISSTILYTNVTPELANKYLKERSENLNVPEITDADKESLLALPFLIKNKAPK